MMQPKVQVRMLATGEIRDLSQRDARLLVAVKRAEYVSADLPAQSYETKVMEPAKRRGRPPKSKDLA